MSLPDQLKDDNTWHAHEKEIMKIWDINNTNKKIREKNKGEKKYRFCDGPPFVSAKTLHFGHVGVSFAKDTNNRYHYMNGYDCFNTIGYDCHGLPLEMEAYKLLNINNSHDVEKMGIDKYNNFCEDIVNRYSGAWNPIFERIARIIDTKDT